MIGQRDSSAVAELPDGRFWILGGSRDFNDRYTSEYYDGDQFRSGPVLPLDGFIDCAPCAVQVTEDITFFGNALGFLYREPTKVFEETSAPMIYPSCFSACGAATTADGSRIVVVAGGVDGNYLDRVQVLDVATGVWSVGPTLPFQVYTGTAVQTEDSFLLIGGFNGNGIGDDYLDTVLEFDPIDMSWIIRGETLPMPRRGHFIMDLDKNSVCE